MFEKNNSKLFACIALVFMFFCCFNIAFASSASSLISKHKDYIKNEDKGNVSKSQSIDQYLTENGITGDDAQKYKEELAAAQSKLYSRLDLSALEEPWMQFVELYKEVFNIALVFGTLTAFLVFIVKMVQLSSPGDHPMLRRKYMTDSLVSLVCIAALGSFGTFFNLFVSPFFKMIDNHTFLATNWRVSFIILLVEYRQLIVGILAVATLSMFAMFVIGFIKLSAAGSNPAARKKCTTTLLTTGIATAGLGSCTLVLSLFYGIFT